MRWCVTTVGMKLKAILPVMQHLFFKFLINTTYFLLVSSLSWQVLEIVVWLNLIEFLYLNANSAGPGFEVLMKQLRADLQATPPLAGSFAPRKGILCVAKFSDDQW